MVSSFFTKTFGASAASSRVFNNDKANASDETLVTKPKTAPKPKRVHVVNSEFTGVSFGGGMPSFCSGHFLNPADIPNSRPLKAKKKTVTVNTTPAAPFNGKNAKASVSDEKIATLKSRDSFETLATTVTSSEITMSSSSSSNKFASKFKKSFFNNHFSNT